MSYASERAMVLTGDEGYIDLSKRRVSPEDIVKCEERFNKGKMVASIMRHVAEKTKTPMETLYQEIGWPLNKKYGHAVVCLLEPFLECSLSLFSKDMSYDAMFTRKRNADSGFTAGCLQALDNVHGP